MLSDPAIERINASLLKEVVVTDSIPIPPEKRGGKIKVVSLAPLIAEAILRIHKGQSVGALFTSEVQFTQEMLLWDTEGTTEPAIQRVSGGNGQSGHAAEGSVPGRMSETSGT